MFFKSLKAFSLIAVFAAFTLAQQPFVPASPRARSFDAQHYIINTRIDYAKKQIDGQTTVKLKPLAGGFDRFELDAEQMQILSVELDRETGGPLPLQFKYAAGKIDVTLDRAYTPADTVSVVVKYTITSPGKGARFVDEQRDKKGVLISPRQVWTQSEPDEARYWFPGYDYPDDKATTEQLITVPSGETAIANGEFLGATENLDGTRTFHYKMPVPHSTYLTSFVIGDYAHVPDKYGDIPLGYYTYRGTEDIARQAYGKTPQMMAVFEKLTGVKFPYNKYDQTIVANFSFGGMENITATTMADTEILSAKFPAVRPYVEDLVSHELAHSWFGDLVTCKTWHQLWLNEGFATFMEAVFKESEGGRPAYLKKIRNDAARIFVEASFNDRRHALVNKYAKADDYLFDATTYQKGGVVIYMLREELGSEVFWKAVNAYLNKYKFQNVSTEDLQAVMEESSGKDLDWFFNQWIYGAGLPELRLNASYDAKKKTVMLDVQQTQKAAADAVVAFRLPVEIEIRTAKGSVKKRLDIAKTKEIFTFPSAAAPVKILFDMNEKVMLKKLRSTGTIPVESVKWPGSEMMFK